MPQELIELRGHLIDSLILPKVLDVILAHGASYEIREIKVGVRVQDPSYCQLFVAHPRLARLEKLLADLARYGATAVERREVRLRRAPRNGVFPEDFYVTTNLDTSLYLSGRWMKVRHPEMDCGIRILPARRRAETVKMGAVRAGDLVVVGHAGVRTVPVESRRKPEDFQFMTSAISAEKPKGSLIRGVARLLREERHAGRPILWVCGPAVVHSGAGPLLETLIAKGYVQILFAGNALAAHDIESALYGTSLGVSLREGALARAGHENHVRAINAIRRVGGIRRAVRRGMLKRGIMRACVRHGVDVVLAGSIRDDGPLPEVITDAVASQDAMRLRTRRVRLAVMVATLLHSVATGNLLPASARVVCADIEQAAVTKLMDRGTFQTIGLATDAQPFLQELLLELGLA